MASQKYEKAKWLAREALEALLDAQKTKASGGEMLAWIKAHYPNDAEDVERSWAPFLTKMLADPAACVDREPGQYGYILRKSGESALSQESPSEDGGDSAMGGGLPISDLQTPQRASRERCLYSLLVEWLQSRDFEAEDTSQLKAGGAWGNPDVVGLKCFEGLGSTLHIELASIEAKISSNNWRRVVFEAVSHKRFADRAYFAFAHGAEEPLLSRLPELDDMRMYGEKYRVGILVVFMEPGLYSQLCQRAAEDLPDLTLDRVRVEELWPALHDPVPATVRESFLGDVLSIKETKELYSFGRES